MATTKTIEKVVEAFLANDFKAITEVLENEVEEANNKGQVTISRRLRNLLSKIPSSSLGAQSLASRRPVFLHGENALVETVQSSVLLEEVILEGTAQKSIDGFLHEWEARDQLLKHNIHPTNKVLLYGLPGTGKTRLAYALANKLDMQLVLVRLDELISSYLGRTGRNIKDIFDLAEREPIIIFLDEIDTIAKHRDDSHELGELKRIVTVLLQNIDNLPEGSIIIGATNHEQLLDSAIWRRFPLKIKFELPDKESRELLYVLYLSVFKNSVDYKMLAEVSEGFSGSVINDICQHIKRVTILDGKSCIDNLTALQSILHFSNPKASNVKVPKKQTYKIARYLKENGYNLRQLEEITGVAYTTLRDNVR